MNLVACDWDNRGGFSYQLLLRALARPVVEEGDGEWGQQKVRDCEKGIEKKVNWLEIKWTVMVIDLTSAMVSLEQESGPWFFVKELAIYEHNWTSSST